MEFRGNTHYENRQHSTAYIPYSYYESIIPDYFPYVPMHSHIEWELNCFREGSGCFFTDEARLAVQSGDVVLAFSNTLHGIETEGRLVYDTVVFNTDMLGGTSDRCYAEVIAPLCGMAADMIYIDHGHAVDQELFEIAKRIVGCAKGNDARLDLLMKSELMRFLWLADQSGALLSGRRELGSSEIRDAIDYMNDHFDKMLTIEILAEHVHISRSWFMQRFKETVGVSAMEYLNRLRVKKVCECLLEGRGISESAFACGFRNLSNFNRLFKATVGVTPREYLKRAGQ